MDELDRLSLAIERAEREFRARMRGGPKGKKGKKPKRPGAPAKTGPGAGCGTGKGGFQSGNVCALEDGTQVPKAIAQSGKSDKAASLPASKQQLQAKAAALKAAAKAQQKKELIGKLRRKASLKKKDKEAKAAADKKAADEAAAAKKKELLQKIRVKKANEQVAVVGTPKSVKQELNEAKAAIASKELSVARTPKSIQKELEEMKAAAEAKAKAQAAYEKAKAQEAAEKAKAQADAAAKAAEKAKPAPVKKVDSAEDLAPKAATKTPGPDELQVIKPLGGSTGAVLAKKAGDTTPDKTAEKFVVKAGKTPGHIANESQADELYAAAGVDVPKQQLHVGKDGAEKKVAEFVNGKTLGELKVQDKAKYDAAVKKLKKDFVVDALLGNYDVVGMNLDNIVVKGGKVYRVDNGGSLTYRAQGKKKDFGADVPEIDTLRSATVNQAAASVFGSLTNKEISAQITRLLKKRDAILAAAKTSELRDTLSKRLDSLANWQKQHKSQQKAAAAAVKSFKPSPKTTQHSEYFTPALAAKIAEFKKSGQAKGESGKRIEQALRTGITTDKMTEAERHRVVDIVWDTIPKAERDAVWKWGSNSWQTLRDKMKAGMYDDPEVKNLIAGLKKLPSYRGLSSRDLSAIPPSQAKKWLSSGTWNTAFPTNPSNTTAASFSSYNRADAIHKKAHGFPAGEVTIVAKGARSIMDTGTKMPYYKHGTIGEKEVLAQHTGTYRVSRHYWVLAKSHKLVKSGKLSAGEEYSKAEIEKALGGTVDLHKSIDVRLVIEVEEIIPQKK